ncbi:MAG TPA: hypothetical protein VMD02_05930 [Candidatus Omnitrophota bacterium]|nr:hypothetical protein [Candidatus Omnitrophota bacterium]
MKRSFSGGTTPIDGRMVPHFARCVLLLSLLISSFSIASAQNLLKNGDFELGAANRIPKFWGTEYYNSTIIPGKNGKNAIKIENKMPMMSLGAQTVPLDYNKVKKVSISAWVKLDGVEAGPETWNKANLQLLFFDAKGNQLGGWPEVGPWEGSFDWKKVGKNLYVPKGCVKAKVVYGLYNCKGIAYFDDIALTPLLQGEQEDPYNLLFNGGFEVWEGWAFGGTQDWGIVYSDVKEGNGALWVKNDKPIWSFASQSVSLDGNRAKKINISGFVKAQDITPGIKSWQLARVNIEFKDGKGKRIGGWPIIDSFSGTFDWKKISKSFDVPAGTKRVDVFAGMLECTGQAWFDGLKLYAYGADGKKLKISGILKTDTSSWYSFKPAADDFAKNITDVSFLLDPPAGKHGFMSVRDGHFYFSDGTRARFWGTNIYAPSTFPDKKDAELMASRLAKYGCNLVRIHHLDAFWADPNIFDKNFDDTQHLSAEALDKLDYLVFQLKQRGIYIFMDLLVDREFKKGDNVPDYLNVERGAKVSGFFDPRVIELQKIYARDLLTHVNPYTGLRYIDDPAIVSAKLINEGMLFYLGTQFGLSKYYMDELDGMFNRYLQKKYGGRDGLVRAWTDKYGRCDLAEDEDPAKLTVQRADIPLKYQRSGEEKREPFRLADTLKFYEQVQEDYFSDMDMYLKSLGLKVPVSGSNHWVNVAPDVKSNATLDYIDRHRYYDHPQFGYGIQVVFEDQPMVKNPLDGLPNNFAFYRVANKPFVVSEWNCCFPNEYRVEGPLMMAAYANLQDWDGVLQFSFNHAGWQAPMEDNFDISAWPNVFTQWPAAAILFYRGDVSSAKNVYEQVLGEKDLYGPIMEDNPIADEPFLPLITRTQISFGAENAPSPAYYTTNFYDQTNKTIKSDTGELLWNYGKGVFTINTDKTQAAVGFLGGAGVALNDVSFSSSTRFASLAISAPDNQPIKESSSLLLTAGARIENKGQKYNESKTQLKDVGSAPILVEGVDARISLRRTPKAVYALDANGKRSKQINITGSGFIIHGSDRAFFYEIVF